MFFQSQPSISSFFRQLTPQEREARSAAADQKARAKGSAKRPLVAPIPAAPAPANGNWLGPVMDVFGRLLDLSLENNAFPAAPMDFFQNISSRLIKLIVTACPNLSWHYGTWHSCKTLNSLLKFFVF
jgi:hypothetical protein